MKHILREILQCQYDLDFAIPIFKTADADQTIIYVIFFNKLIHIAVYRFSLRSRLTRG